MGSKATCGGGEQRITAEAPPLCLSRLPFATFIDCFFLPVGRFLLLLWDAYESVPVSGCVHHGHRCAVPGAPAAFADAPASFIQVIKNKKTPEFMGIMLYHIMSRIETQFTPVVTELHLFGSEHSGKRDKRVFTDMRYTSIIILYFLE